MEITTTAEIVTTEVAEASASAFSNISVEPMNFINNLSYMGIGMLGIFIVIGIIIAATVVMNKLTSGKKN